MKDLELPTLTIRAAVEADVPLILEFIRELAAFERLSHEVVATEEGLRSFLFENRASAEVIFGYLDDEPVGFALYFENFSTFLFKWPVINWAL